MNKKTISILAILISVCFGNFATAQLAEPMEEHKILKYDIGIWDAQITMWMSPDSDPMKSNGTETNTTLGGMWVVSEFKGNFMGSPFTGHSTMGYDPIKKKYIGTWVDSTSSHMTHMSGSFDAESKTMTMLSKGIGMDGKPSDGKNVVVYKGHDERNMTMFMKTDGEWVKSMEIKYTRKKK